LQRPQPAQLSRFPDPHETNNPKSKI